MVKYSLSVKGTHRGHIGAKDEFTPLLTVQLYVCFTDIAYRQCKLTYQVLNKLEETTLIVPTSTPVPVGQKRAFPMHFQCQELQNLNLIIL